MIVVFVMKALAATALLGVAATCAVLILFIIAWASIPRQR